MNVPPIPDEWLYSVGWYKCSLSILADYLEEIAHPWTDMLRELDAGKAWTVEVPTSRPWGDAKVCLGDKLLPFGGTVRKERKIAHEPGLVARQTVCERDFRNWCGEEYSRRTKQ